MKKKTDETKVKKYTQEFKEQAVELSQKIGTSEASRKLDIPLSNLQRWRSKGHTRNSTSDVLKLQKENKRLKKELEEERMIVDMLKKTTAYFSKETLK